MSDAEGFQAPICFLCACMVLARLVRFSGRCPIRLPTRNVLRIACFAHFEQSLLSLLMWTPQSEQRCSGRGWSTEGTSLPFISRLLRCVRRVAISCLARLDAGLEIE